MKHATSKTKKSIVFVGLSGGVDSSVSAALLLEQGYEVVGVFMKVWQPDFIECTWKEERRDAMRVAAHLGIPFLTFDFEDVYKRDVADYMISEYKAGRTPNPDVMCNKSVKFGAFLAKARAMGADYIATGHYAQNGFDSKKGKYIFRAGTDTEKDQSYFLWTLDQEKLAHALFPVGHMKKANVRKLAKKFGLPTEMKKDSQGVCFLGKLDMKEFLKHFIDTKKGDVLDEDGTVIGHHEGATFFTLGERHGFTIFKKGIDDAPYYIVGKDIKRNTLTVAMHDKKSASHKKSGATLVLEHVNWTLNEPPKIGKVMQARLRYRQTPISCTLHASDDTQTQIELAAKDATASSGQSVVLYSGDVCLGGGVIV